MILASPHSQHSPQLINRLLGALDGVLPVSQFGEEIRGNVREAMAAVLRDMDVVTRDEFEAQQQVLLKTRKKVEQLEVKLKEIQLKD